MSDRLVNVLSLVFTVLGVIYTLWINAKADRLERKQRRQTELIISLITHEDKELHQIHDQIINSTK